MLALYPTADHTIPRSDSGASPQRFRSVQGASVIQVDAATHRGSKSFSGVFELAAPANDPRQFQKKLCAEVICAWHGTKPFTSYPHIHILGEYKVMHDYNGEVVDNLA